MSDRCYNWPCAKPPNHDGPCSSSPEARTSKNDVDRLVAQRGLLMRALTLCIAWADHSVIKHRTAKDRDPAHAAVIKDLGDWAASINEQVDELRASLPAECSGNPASCPENEGRGCACSPRETKASHSVTLNGYQLKAALEFVAPDNEADQLKSDVSIEWGEGHAGPGYYAFMSEYPDEGSIALDENCPKCGGSGRLTIYDTATYVGQPCSPIGDEPCPECSSEKSRGDSPPPIVMTASTPDELYGVDTGMSIPKAPQT